MSRLNLDLQRREYETLGTDQKRQEELLGATAYIEWPFPQFAWDLSLPPKQVLSSELCKSIFYQMLHPEIVRKTFELLGPVPQSLIKLILDNLVENFNRYLFTIKEEFSTRLRFKEK